MAQMKARAGLGASARYALGNVNEYGTNFAGGLGLDARRELPSKSGPARDEIGDPTAPSKPRSWLVPLAILAGLYFLAR